MADFLTTPLGTFVLILAQSLAVVGFVMISLLFLVYALYDLQRRRPNPKIGGGVPGGRHQ